MNTNADAGCPPAGQLMTPPSHILLPVHLIGTAPRDAHGWRDINTAPRTGEVVWTYTAEREGLPAFQGPCAYHPDAGWCTDELRHVTHWMPLRDRYAAAPGAPADPEALADVLRGMGWVCTGPIPDVLAEPAVGQIWVSPVKRVEPRTVVEVGVRSYWAEPCVSFTTPSRPAHPRFGASCLRVSAWNAWARRTGARVRS